jgi:hypothetical protein
VNTDDANAPIRLIKEAPKEIGAVCRQHQLPATGCCLGEGSTQVKCLRWMQKRFGLINNQNVLVTFESI